MELLISESAKDQKPLMVNGVKFIDLCKFYEEAFYITDKTVYDYCIHLDFKKKDVKKIFINAFIFKLCEFIKNNKTKTIFYVDQTKEQLLHFSEDIHLKSICFKLSIKIDTLLPIFLLKQNISYEEFLKKYSEGDINVCIEIDKAVYKSMQFSHERFTFKKLNLFLKRNELSFLKNAYFTQHQVKLSLLS